MIVYCATCGEEASTRADGTARIPYQHKYGPVSHGEFELPLCPGPFVGMTCHRPGCLTHDPMARWDAAGAVSS